MAASFTLTVSLVIQTLMMSIWLRIKESGEITRVARNWRWASATGIAAALASLGWFTASTFQNASLVRALGQVELIFTLIVTTFVFREKVSLMEYLGTLLIGAGIVLIVTKG